MTTERFSVEVKDKVDPTISTKLRSISTSARTAQANIDKLQVSIDKLGGSSLAQKMEKQAAAAQRQQIQQQRLILLQNKAAEAAEKAMNASMKTSITSEKRAEAAAKATERQAKASKAQTEAQNAQARGAVNLAAAQERLRASTAAAEAAQSRASSAASKASADAVRASVLQSTAQDKINEAAARSVEAQTRAYTTSIMQSDRLAQSTARTTAAQAKAAQAVTNSSAAQQSAANRQAIAQNNLAASANRAQIAQNNLAASQIRLQNAQTKQVTATNNVNRAQQNSNALFSLGARTQKEYNNALRMVPAQITDIVVSLQGGQAPLTVLLQQGGQLKDMFGGILPAARALGGVLLRMVLNPFVAITGALVTLGFAYKQGSSEIDNLRRSMLLSGNQAGKTTDELVTMSRSIAKTADQTVSASSEALSAIVSFGSVGSENIEKFTVAAMSIEKRLKIPLKELGQNLVALAESPAEASARLTKEYNYLTPAVYRQIKALQDEGRATEAASLAQDTYMSEMARRAETMKKHLGTIERAWEAVWKAVKKTWDKILEIGRSDTNQEALAKLEGELAQRTKERWKEGTDEQWARNKKILEDRIQAIKDLMSAEKTQGEQAAKLNEGNRRREDWVKEGEGLKEQSEILKERLTANQKLRDDDLISQEEYESRKAALIKRYSDKDKVGIKDKGGIKVSDSRIANLKAQLDEAEEYFRRLQVAGANASKLNKGEEEELKISRELEKVTDKKSIARLKESLAIAKQLAAQLRINKTYEDSAKSIEKLVDETDKQGDSIKQAALDQEAANHTLGKSKVAIEQAALAQMQLQLAEADSSDRFDPAYVKSLQNKVDWQKRYSDALQASEDAQLRARSAEALSSAQDLEEEYRDEFIYSGRTARERERITAERAIELKYARLTRQIDKSSASDDAKNSSRAELDEAKRIEKQAAFNRILQEENRKLAEDIEGSLTGAFMRSFDKAGTLIENLRDSVVTMFKNIILEPTIKGWLSPISSGLTGAMGFGTGAEGGGSGGLTGAFNTGSALYSAMTNGISASISGAFAKFAGSSIGQTLGLSNSAAIMGNNPSAFVPAGGQLTGLGSSIGAGLGMLGNGLLGYGLSKGLSNGYSAGKGVNAIAGIASAFLGPVAGVVGGLINRTFGRKLKDVGIEGTLGGSAGFEGSSYQFYKGGWLRSDKTVRNPLDPQIAEMLSTSFKTIQAQVGTFATVLGLETSKIESFTTSLKVSTQGLDEAGISEAIQEALLKGSNELAQQVIGTWTSAAEEITTVVTTGGWTDAFEGSFERITDTVQKSTYVASEYAKAGEEAIDTLTRLATSFITVNTVADAMGYGFMQASMAGADAASTIAEAFGGLEAFAKTTSSYLENFYTDAEQKAATTRQVSRALGAVGLDVSAESLMNITRPQIRKFVEGVAEQFGVESKEYVTAMEQANVLAGITEALPSVLKSSSDLDSASKSAEEAAKSAEEAYKAWQDINEGLEKDAFDLSVALLRQMGQEEAALNAERSRAIKTYDAQQIALYDANQATQKLIDSMKKQAEITVAMTDLAIAFSGDSAKEVLEYQRISDNLRKSGVNIDVDALMAADRQAIHSYVTEFVGLTTVTEDAKLAVISAAQSMLTLKDNAQSLKQTLADTAFSAADKLLSPGDAFEFKSTILAQRYVAGVEGSSDEGRIAAIAKMFQEASPEQIKNATLELLKFGNLSDAAKNNLIEVSVGLLELVDSTEAAAKALMSQAEDIMEWVKNLAADRAGLATPEQELQARSALYQKDYAAAMAGDEAAIKRITETAQKYIDAQKVATTSSDITQSVISRIIAEMVVLANKVGGAGANFQIPSFGSGGYHSGGLAWVGEYGRELVDLAPSHIYNARQSADITNMDPILEELQALRETVEQYGQTQSQLLKQNVQASIVGSDMVTTGVSSSVKELSDKIIAEANKPKLK